MTKDEVRWLDRSSSQTLFGSDILIGFGLENTDGYLACQIHRYPRRCWIDVVMMRQWQYDKLTGEASTRTGEQGSSPGGDR